MRMIGNPSTATTVYGGIPSPSKSSFFHVPATMSIDCSNGTNRTMEGTSISIPTASVAISAPAIVGSSSVQLSISSLRVSVAPPSIVSVFVAPQSPSLKSLERKINLMESDLSFFIEKEPQIQVRKCQIYISGSLGIRRQPPPSTAEFLPLPNPLSSRSRRRRASIATMEQIEQWKEQVSQLRNVAIEHLRHVPVTQLYVAVAIVIFTTLLLLSRLLKHAKANTIVLTGLSGSGKTVLFHQLRDGSTHQGTVTSMEPNEGTFVLSGETTKKGKIKPVHVVDVPGHSRLRAKLDEYLPQAAAIVFVVDALDFLPNCRAASEYLFDLLSKGSVVKKKIPLLILCNKTDKVTAHTKEFIRRQLEKEIDKLRASRSAISDADIANEFTLGVPGEPFSFTQCSNKIITAEAAGSTGEISQLEEFIREFVKP
ncbi:hypothetical protein RIF29_39222 [Crotalaria pallida]|uniref:Signal recognition particle receptor subunit beta n=1 Tax=Crotalaria pallida TaxID=3830 RepID=A0AAN9E1N9_CROPI